MRTSMTGLHTCMPTAALGYVGTRRYSSKYGTVQFAGYRLKNVRLVLFLCLALP